MRIVCPACQAAYEVPEKLLSGPPRKVRCARCGEAWTPEPVRVAAPEALPVEDEPPPEPEPEQEPVPEREPEPLVPETPASIAAVVPRIEDRLVPEPAEPSSGRRPAIIAGSAWAASVAVLVGAGWACVAWRGEIMALWAPSRRLFALLGLG